MDKPLELLDSLLRWIKERDPTRVFIEDSQLEAFLSSKEPLVVEEEVERPDVSLSVKSPTYEELLIEGTVEEFRHYFTSRYQRVRAMLEQRGFHFVPLSDLTGRKSSDEAYVVGIVSDIERTGAGYRVVVEDPRSRVTLRIPSSERALEGKAELLLPDMVVGFRVRIREGSVAVRDIILPDIPSELLERTEGPDVNICIISDVHVGSSKFVSDLFAEFLEWISSDEEDAVKTRYLIINGDLVDGVYVYPGQERELVTPSLSAQFEEAARLISKIPSRIEVVYVPGNHEPVRKALPQPPIQPKYREILDAARPMVYTGNPALLGLGDFTILAFHGQSFDDIIQVGSRFSYSSLESDVTDMMEFLIKCRHLAPTYGESTPLLPLQEDYLVIAEPPSLFATGHLHVAGQRRYKGIFLVNTGTWQEQTLYQESLGIEPTLGIAAIYNMRSNTLRMKRFG